MKSFTERVRTRNLRLGDRVIVTQIDGSTRPEMVTGVRFETPEDIEVTTEDGTVFTASGFQEILPR